MSSVPLMPSRRYPSPEGTPPLSPYHTSNDVYGNKISREHGMHCNYSNQPGSPLFFAPATPSSPQNLSWSSPGQVYGSSASQTILYDQGSAQYNNFGANWVQYQHSIHPHHLGVDPTMTTPTIDLPGQDLHIQMRGPNMLGPQESDLMASNQQTPPVAFQTGLGQYSHNESAPSSHFMPRYQSSWPNAAVYIPQSPLSQSASPSRSWTEPSARMAAAVCSSSEERNQKFSSSGCFSMSSPTADILTVAIRQRQRKDKSLRQHKCETPGCHKDFDRSYNAKKHQETVHGNPERKQKCPLNGCESSFRGFLRKHDMDRHVITKHREYALKHEDEHGKVVDYICDGCGRVATRMDTLKRHKQNACHGRNAVKIGKTSSTGKAQRARASYQSTL